MRGSNCHVPSVIPHLYIVIDLSVMQWSPISVQVRNKPRKPALMIKHTIAGRPWLPPRPAWQRFGASATPCVWEPNVPLLQQCMQYDSQACWTAELGHSTLMLPLASPPSRDGQRAHEWAWEPLVRPVHCMDAKWAVASTLHKLHSLYQPALLLRRQASTHCLSSSPNANSVFIFPSKNKKLAIYPRDLFIIPPTSIYICMHIYFQNYKILIYYITLSISSVQKNVILIFR